MRNIVAVLFACASCVACNSIIPDHTIEITASQSITLAELLGVAAAAAAVYYVVDPLAPNWAVAQTRVSDNRWRIAMQKKRFTTGGDGEAVMLLHSQAHKLAATSGFRSYKILSWSEGVQSDMPIAYRWARGEVELHEYAPPMPVSEDSTGTPGTTSLH
jgi:hypothetical protein